MFDEEYEKIHAKSHGLSFIDIDKASQYVRKFEGLKLKPYTCPSGKLTIGYGHNLEDNGITLEIAEDLLFLDLKVAEMECYGKISCYPILDDARKFVLLDMCFNMGINKLLTFKKMLSALTKKDYKTAAKEMLDSKYARQVGQRAKTLAKILETGVW